jgi:hypothetical protein
LRARYFVDGTVKEAVDIMRYRIQRPLWIAGAILVVALAAIPFVEPIFGALPAPAAQSAVAPASSDVPFAELRKKSKFTRTGLTPAEAQDLGYELARNNFALIVMHTAGVDDALVREFGDSLGERQLAWQLDRNGGHHEQKLLEALNRQLGLDSAPGYLQIRRRELRRMRLEVWIRVPEVSTGLERQGVASGQAIFPPRMSPFEAYLVSDLILHQKVFNDDYLRTDAEDKRLGGRPSPPKRPGLYVVTPNPRGQEFHRHVETIARTKWNTPEAVMQTVNDILEESER